MDLQYLDELEARTIYILREAFATVSPLTMLWSVGKDSNALLWMCRKAFYGRIPFPLAQLDTEMELPEVYEFRDNLVKEWGLDLKVELCPPEEEMDATFTPGARAAARKTEGLKALIANEGFKGIILGIRRDEQSIRGKERVFSPRDEAGAWDVRDQPPEVFDQYKTEIPAGAHLRIHPLLDWTEIDIWRYTKREGIPIVPLYFSRNGKRYRSLGEKNITFPVDSDASTIDEIIAELLVTKTAERAGRSMDHESEDAFERLRTSGYM